MTKPFKVNSSDINKLNDIQLTQLLKELLHAEAFKFDIAQRDVEVALNVRVGDGGEDGRIQWENGPESTDYLPCRLTMFQNKATEMSKAGYAKEILNSSGDIKQKVEEVLSQDGSYIFFTTQELNSKQKINERITEVRGKLQDLKKAYSDTCDIRIYDSAQIAGWVNQFVSTVVSVQQWLGKPLERGLKTYEIWSEHEELSHLPYAPVDHREDVILQLRTDLPTPKLCFRLTGLSGLGKTRTAFQVFADDETIRNLVVYVDASLTPRIDALVADWVTLGLRAILVVDNCEYRLHERLVREVLRQGSQISLLSLDYNFDSVSDQTNSFRLKQLSNDDLLQLLIPVYQYSKRQQIPVS